MGDIQDNSHASILELSDVVRSVETVDGMKPIIDRFNYSFTSGKIHTIVGPSGSGKSSLLRLINRLDEKTSGDITFLGRSIESYPVTDLRIKIALVFQTPYLFPGTVKSNLTYSCGEQNSNNDEALGELLQKVGLEPGLLNRPHDKLSVGQQQRVALARSLSLEPDILMLDEPTSALDPGAARTIEDLLRDLNERFNLTLIMVTHNFEQALRLKGTSLVLVEGRLVESGESKELFEHPKNELTRKFIAGDLR
ncbi:MAG: ATP-binding cassette domain-containing protein [Candidatus Zixiibacteriota bacterium]